MKDVLGHDASKVSIGLEEIEASDWMELVYGPDISAKESTLLKRPGYGPLAAAPQQHKD